MALTAGCSRVTHLGVAMARVQVVVVAKGAPPLHLWFAVLWWVEAHHGATAATGVNKQASMAPHNWHLLAGLLSAAGLQGLYPSC